MSATVSVKFPARSVAAIKHRGRLFVSLSDILEALEMQAAILDAATVSVEPREVVRAQIRYFSELSEQP